ncbi:flagellin lysine-N-methylase, partial [Burkholderia sp. SIMBA_045]
FVMKSDLSCPFLNEEKLCSIQLKLGEDFLSHTCKTYPRVTQTVDDVVELSATLSCPEAARLALLNPNKMQFNRNEEARDTKPPTGFSPS